MFREAEGRMTEEVTVVSVFPDGSEGAGVAECGTAEARGPFKDPEREVPILVEAGNYIRFVPVDEAEYKRIQAQVEDGSYQCVIHEEV